MSTRARRPGARRGRFLLVAPLLIAGCLLDQTTGSRLAPEISYATIVRVPGNALAVVVTARVRHADSVKVRFGLVDMPLDSSAPAVLPESETATIPVLGLLPDTSYVMVVVAYAGAM